MQIERYLRQHQPIIYKTFINALESNHLSHAYLISGVPGTPLLETAKYLAKSILCDDPSPLACNNCITCLRIDDDNYPDFVIYDGSKSAIKKEEVESIEKQFDKTAFENKGIMIYILHLVENMTPTAINSILKFLEEPELTVYAFLTTNNENNVLPTILSRCQLLRLKLIDRKEIINNAVLDNVQKEDAELLSYFYNDSELIKESLDLKDFNEIYNLIKKSIKDLLLIIKEDSKEDIIYYVESNIIPFIKTKESIRLFIDILIQVFEDLVSLINNKEPILLSQKELLTGVCQKIKHIDKSLMELLKCRNLINTNVNISLLIEHIMNFILKGD